MPFKMEIDKHGNECADIGLDVDLPLRSLYFINEEVEWGLTRYNWTGCTSVPIRNEIMANATELIRQIIRKQRLHIIYPGQDEAAFMDLLNIAWCQIEKTLYKYQSSPHCRACFKHEKPNDSILHTNGKYEHGIIELQKVIDLHNNKCPHCGVSFDQKTPVRPKQGRFGGSVSILYRGNSKVFNMWSQIARTVILAHIKKESRDKKNSDSYTSHVAVRRTGQNIDMDNIFNEMNELWRNDEQALKIISAIKKLNEDDIRAYEGIIPKIMTLTGLPRISIINFMHIARSNASIILPTNISKNRYIRRDQEDEEE